MAYSLSPVPWKRTMCEARTPKTEILVAFDKKADKERGIRK